MVQRRRIEIIGIGAGDPDFVTAQAAAALRSVSGFVVAEKGPDDPLVAARRALLRHFGAAQTPVVAVRDPRRERRPEATATPADYERAVRVWHDARAAVYREAFDRIPGDIGLLVWGDPALYDSTIRIVDRIAEQAPDDYEVRVIPGISAVSALAARHRMVLHEIGRPVHITTGRQLASAVAAGQDNIVVMLDGALTCRALTGAWEIYWGANLGTEHEALARGDLATAIDEIGERRAQVKAAAGWVMDVYLVRRQS